MLARSFVFIVVLAATATAWAQSPPLLEPYTSYPLSQEAQSSAVGDLNGDGWDDVAVAAWPSVLYLFLQNADGLLKPPVELAAPNMPLGLAIGDLNADGRPDLVVGGDNGGIWLYYQQENGSLSLPTICFAYGLVNSIALGDVNADGLTDIVATAQYEGAAYSPVSVLTQDVFHQFSAPAIYLVNGSNSRCVSLLDYNDDQMVDIVVLVDDSICYLPQTVYGSFPAPYFLPAQYAHSMAVGDVTGDTREDLVFTVATNRPDAAVGVYGRDGMGASTPLTSYPAYDYAEAMVLTDLSGDGKLDAVTAHAAWETLTVFRQTTEGAFGPWEHYDIPYCNYYQPGAMSCGDLNSDGWTDIALADWYNGLVVLLHSEAAVVDVTAPDLQLTPSVTSLGPPNGKTVDLPVEVFGSDNESGLAGMRLSVIDEYGEVQPEMDVISGNAIVPLVAYVRGADKDGRVYTLVLTGTDVAGNTASVEATVVVTRGKGKK